MHTHLNICVEQYLQNRLLSTRVFEVVDGVREMLEPAGLAEFRKNAAALDNRAIFEIPEILAKLLEQSTPKPDSAAAQEVSVVEESKTHV